MQHFVVFVTLVLTVSAMTDLEKWKQFKKTYDKYYKSTLEEEIRFNVFQNNLRNIEKHNERYNNGLETYYMGVNKFADWNTEEFNKFLTFKKPSLSVKATFEEDPNFIAPESIDWRERGAVQEVQDQGDCGSSWAFSAVGGVEGQNVIKNNLNISLSVQEVMDCSDKFGEEACDGGYIEAGFLYIKEHGVASEVDYPYISSNGVCHLAKKTSVNVTDYVTVDKTENALLEAVATVGPISVMINYELLQFYEGGIFNNSDCAFYVDQAVLVVGYGVEDNIPYWIIKNSFGVNWGENGYLRLIRNAHRQCGIGTWNVYPIVA